MAATASQMLALETQAPDFSLKDVVSGKTVSLETFADKPALLMMFICRHCPFVQHIKKELARLGRDYQPQGLGIMAVSSNDAGAYPEDAPESLKAMALEEGFSFPYGYDESQETAQAYGAACTPDFFLFDQQRRLVYRGQLDDSRPSNNKPVTGRDLRAAIEATLNGDAVDSDQKPSIGCNIKWKPGNEPPYFKGR
jgi:peroxiredoxin